MEMESAAEKEFTALGGLFLHIITDLKNSAPIWEDFLVKAGKLHTQLRSTLLASTSFLDSFQKIADLATNTRGATKEIGTTLTRLCLRQRSVEAKLKIFSNALLEAFINPMQEKLEEWKKTASNLEKEHSKEYKRAKQDLKKKSSDTLKLQKKVRKVGVMEIKRTLDYALQDVTDKYLLLEEIEKQSVRKALIEERSHFCLFVGYLQPVLESEMAMLHEINHIQEIIDTLTKITGDPHLLPSTSEQVISDVKSSENTWSFHVTPPGSPGSLGSRKSSVCSISSINSSSSGSLKSHSSRYLSHSQTLGRKHLNSVTSQDSGFTSQDTLYNNVISTCDYTSQLATFHEGGSTALSTPSSPVPPVTPGTPEKESNSLLTKYQRPHTISSAYEKLNHSRPALTVHTFLPLDQVSDFQDSNYCSVGTFKSFGSKFKDRNCLSQPGTPIYNRPSLPERADDNNRLRPSLPEKSASVKAKHDKLYNEAHKSLPDFNKTPPDQIVPHPIYVNSSELLTRNSASSDSVACKTEATNEVQNRKELAAVLNEGLLLQSKWVRSQQETEVAPAIPKHCRSTGTSETLPRSRGSWAEDEILEWQMYNMSLCNNPYLVTKNGNQRRPMSIAGVSTGFLLPRKANTLQRVGSTNGPKPPTPVRRSSSITSTSKLTDGSSVNKPDPTQSLSSGAGEVRYSPNLRELKSNSSLPSPQEKFHLSLRHVEVNHSSENASNTSPNRDSSSSSENNIVTDVSDSRARLIQDLNSTLQQQRKPAAKKPLQNEPPAVPPRNASKEHMRPEEKHSVENVLYGHHGPARKTPKDNPFLSKTRSEERCTTENTLYGQRSSHTFSAKPMASHEIQRQFSQKPRLKECLSQSDLLQCTKDWSYESKNGNELPDNEKLFKRSFVVALNARLAEHTEQDHQPWLLKNDKNYRAWNSGFHRPKICRESLMDQIKRGTRLRRVTCNDRSSPRLA